MPPKNSPTVPNMINMRLVIECDSLGFLFLLIAAPPASSKRLEERRGVRVARRLRLNETDLCLFVLALRIEEREIARRAELQLLGRHVEAFARGGLGIRLRLERDRVELQRKQHVGDVLEGGENGLLILREGLVVGGLRAALPRLELSCMKNRLKHACPDVPQQIAAIEEIRGVGRAHPIAAADAQLREHERLRDADARIRLAQNGYGRADGRPPAHEIRG